METYTQLTREQRYQIYALLKAGHIQSEIARLIKKIECSMKYIPSNF
jgi:IS30 family transposase